MNESTTEHGVPPEGLCCLATMEDITLEDGNYVEYQCYPSMKWKPALYEQSVVEQLLQTQFSKFVERVKTTDCQAELRRLLASGPPVYVSDPHGLPLDDDHNGDTHIVQVWFASTNEERSAVLDGALQGEARDALWQELREFLIVEGKEEGDDDDDEEVEEGIQPKVHENGSP